MDDNGEVSQPAPPANEVAAHDFAEPGDVPPSLAPPEPQVQGAQTPPVGPQTNVDKVTKTQNEELSEGNVVHDELPSKEKPNSPAGPSSGKFQKRISRLAKDYLPGLSAKTTKATKTLGKETGAAGEAPAEAGGEPPDDHKPGEKKGPNIKEESIHDKNN